MVDNSKENFETIQTANISEPSTPLEEFAKKVFDKLIAENIPPIPYNYKVTFFNMLDNEDETFRKQVYELISLEETNELEKDMEFEKRLKASFKFSKEILQRTAILYKYINLINDLINSYKKEIENAANPKLVEKLIKNLDAKIDKISSKFANELKEIKRIYSKNVEILKEVESSSIFDSQYGVYNKNFFVKELKKEVALIDRFKHTSSIIILKIKDSILKNLKSEKSKILVNRSVAKIMLKTSRRTDIVAHLGGGKFAMLLKHTDRIGASKTVERLADMISYSSIFLEGEEVNMEIVAGIAEIISAEISAEDYILNAFKALEKAESEGILYYLYEEGM